MIGAFAGFAVMLSGVVLAMFSDSAMTSPPLEPSPGSSSCWRVLGVRVLVVCILFLREKDWHYAAVSLGVLVILLLGVGSESGKRLPQNPASIFLTIGAYAWQWKASRKTQACSTPAVNPPPSRRVRIDRRQHPRKRIRYGLAPYTLAQPRRPLLRG